MTKKGKMKNPYTISIMSHEFDVFVGGIRDSLSPQYPLHQLWESSRIKKIIGTSLAFNSIVFIYNVYYTYFVGAWYPSAWQWFYPIFYVTWVIPSFTAALFLNSMWSSQLANLVCETKYGAAGATASSVSDPRQANKQAKQQQYAYIEFMYGTFLIYIFHAMLGLVKLGVSLSIIRLPILYLGYAWLSGFYLFETRLIYKGYTLPQRIEFLQRRWLYFLGYGTPLALIYMIFPYDIVYTLYYLLSDLMVLNTIHLQPKRYEKLVSLPIFGVVQSFTNWLTQLLPKTSENQE